MTSQDHNKTMFQTVKSNIKAAAEKAERIIFVGPFMWAWGLWHIAWAAALLPVAFYLGLAASAQIFVPLYLAFLPLEVAGVYFNEKTDDGDREVARTMSQWRQWLALKGKAWEWAAAGTGVVDAAIIGSIVTVSLNPIVGWSLGLLLLGWLTRHYGWRDKFG